MDSQSADSLVGRFVHTHRQKGEYEGFPNYRPIDKQGKITAQHGDHYEVQWFSWLDGAPNKSTMHLLEEMVFDGWTFYANHEDWVKSGDDEGKLRIRQTSQKNR
jgi:hypothetical protein